MSIIDIDRIILTDINNLPNLPCNTHKPRKTAIAIRAELLVHRLLPSRSLRHGNALSLSKLRAAHLDVMRQLSFTITKKVFIAKASNVLLEAQGLLSQPEEPVF